MGIGKDLGRLNSVGVCGRRGTVAAECDNSRVPYTIDPHTPTTLATDSQDTI